ncbi:MAG: hypothetical protein RDV48_15105 [Candidatus Eremiobacteraeota bacterium]|nr:hypothetical protein [Candidatus Eremiobacteraeota bacterium]
MINPAFHRITSAPDSMPQPGDAQAGPAQDVAARMARETAGEHPGVKRLHQEVVELTGKKEALYQVLTLSRDERLEILKSSNPTLYDEIGKSVYNKLNSTAFRICAGTWLAGAAVAIGTVTAAVMGAAISTPLSLSFPAFLGLGTGVSRLYLHLAEKKKGPAMRDELAIKCFEYQKGELEQAIEKKKAQEEELVKKVASDNQALVDAASGSGAGGEAIKDEDGFVDIGGVKLKVNKSMDLITGPPLKALHPWLS